MGRLNAGIITVTPFQQNCTLLFDDTTKAGVVVDPGGDVDHILEVIKSNGVKVEAIWITHGHIDHAGGAAALREALAGENSAPPIEGPHEADRFLLQSLERQGRESVFRQPAALLVELAAIAPPHQTQDIVQ